ncbi:neutral zinc metallopeptidase [Pseudanabaena sp. FACHB-2040]|uniref:KPN_02809 family neutral zinc metallopeptidase n=1 Tax=Pseudanabaena sp. FACHB-2040 TaxID=2692859 RepID=UPI001685BE28|nr:neutral zinc metallopeptidase [Pseudanabaena sp. FACHB-2040]MBD0269562.1 zinc metallopeptidase [Cyanobacteria bacterium Co-bin8]MBD2260958.1 zinc metallopeptidase [Pseudanabaena sp. FACHB-2040]
MKWETGRRSRNIEDRRGRGMATRGGRGVSVGGGRGVAVGGGFGTLLLMLLVAFLGGDPSDMLSGGSAGGDYYAAPGATSPQEEQLADFTSAVLADTEDTWHAIFQEQIGQPYQEPRLVLFSGSVDSACGFAQAAMGPFYCPADERVYIDLSFYEDLKYQLQAPGDFAQAYVISHEVGHHVQNLLGISSQVRRLQQRASTTDANDLSVRLELQADCFAGVWANHAQRSRQILEQGDVEEALNAASQIGDDRLQQETRGYVTPDSFTHGSSEQRVRWFQQGIQTGELAECNTFDVASL